MDSNSSSSIQSANSPDKYEKASISYHSESDDNDDSINSSIVSEENNWIYSCTYSFFIDKLKPNSKSNIKEHTLSSDNLNKALYDAHQLKTPRKPTNKDQQTKSNKKLKQIHFSPIIFVKQVIPSGKKDR